MESKIKREDQEDMTTIWQKLNAEPSVDEILDDPIVRLLMRGDGVGENEVRRLIETVREGLAAAMETTASDGADEAIVVAPSMTEKVARAA